MASLDFFEVTGLSPIGSKSSRSLVFFYARVNRLPGKGEIRGEMVSILYLLPCLLPLSPPPPYLSTHFSRLQEDISAPGHVCSWSCGGVTGAVAFASEEGKAAEVQILPGDFM